MRNRYCLAAGAALLLSAGALPYADVMAQTAAPNTSTGASASSTAELAEIVITAQKRTERLEDVPVSASVISADELANSNVSDV
jgi:iron complex outermembrane receptor protein